MSGGTVPETPASTKAGATQPGPDPDGNFVELLRATPIFSQFSETDLRALSDRLSERNYSRGDTLWRAGDQGDELLIVVSGRLDVWGLDQSGAEVLVGRIEPGECVGEMALILDERRSATVTCSRTARVLVLEKPEFRRVVRDDVTLLANLAAPLSRRAASLARRRPVARGTIVVGVVADPGISGASLVAAAVAELAEEQLGCKTLLARMGGSGLSIRSIVSGKGLSKRQTDSGGGSSVIDVAVDGTLSGEELASTVDALLSHMGDDNIRLLVVDLPPIPREAVELAASACEYVVQITDQPGPAIASAARVLQVVNRRNSSMPPLALNHCEPFVLPDVPEFAAAQRPVRPLALVDRRHPASRVLGRLVRKILGATVGIALGGGAAFGIAHIGVLYALDEAGIPVDLVAGTSMGSIVAIGYAGGMTGADLRGVAKELGNVRRALGAVDISLSGTGLMDGRKMVNTFAGLLPITGFDELVLPCRTVATDIQSGERVVIGTGRLDAAFRASSSIPLLFAPASHEGRFLVDGAIVDPVPADVVEEMGADMVIAVNVVPELDRNVKTAMSKASEVISRLNPLASFSEGVGAPHVMDIFMNSLQITQHELGKFKGLAADIRVDVDLAGFTWVDFTRATDIVAKGAAATALMLPQIQSAYQAKIEGR